MNRTNYAYLFALLILPFLYSCEPEADELESKSVPVDQAYYDISLPIVSDVVDFNGNRYYPRATVTSTISVNDNAPDGYSKTVYFTLSLENEGSVSILGQTQNVTLSKGGAGQEARFEGVDFDNRIINRGDYNLAVDVVDVSDNRRIVSRGFTGNLETINEDSTISYEVQDLVWSNGTDNSGDGYYTGRDFTTRIVSLGESGTIADVEVSLARTFPTSDTTQVTEITPVASLQNYNIERKGFGQDINLAIDADAKALTRSEYSLILLAFEKDGDTIVNASFSRDDSKQLAFETTEYDSREYSVTSVMQDSIMDNDMDTYPSRIDFIIPVSVNNNNLMYDTIGGTQSPEVWLYYQGPATSGDLVLWESMAVTPGSSGRFTVSDLDSGIYDFEIEIREPASNVVVPNNDGIVVESYDKTDFPELGDVKLETVDEDM